MKIFPACQIVEADGRLGIDVASRYGQEWTDALKTFKTGFVQVILKRPTKAKTEAQRSAFHALLALYFKSGLHSSESFERLKVDLKIRYGWIFNYDMAGETYQVIVSTEKYTMEWYSRLIDGTISEMEQSGIISSRYGGEFREIVEGMQSENSTKS